MIRFTLYSGGLTLIVDGVYLVLGMSADRLEIMVEELRDENRRLQIALSLGASPLMSLAFRFLLHDDMLIAWQQSRLPKPTMPAGLRGPNHQVSIRM